MTDTNRHWRQEAQRLEMTGRERLEMSGRERLEMTGRERLEMTGQVLETRNSRDAMPLTSETPCL